METPLKTFRDDYLEMLLDFLWREWSALGVAGQRKVTPNHVIDPEALLLFTCSLGRYDQRLFDEVMDWLSKNGRFINVQRMRNILRREKFSSGDVLSAVADWLMQHDDPVKWKLLAKADEAKEPSKALFYLQNGHPLPKPSQTDDIFTKHGLIRNLLELRGYSQSFSSKTIPCLLLKLRALMGVNARCDVLAFLAQNINGYAGEIARELYYSQKAIHDIMKDMACSGLITSVRAARERTYRLTPETRSFLLGDNKITEWINWPILLLTAENVWVMIEELQTADLESHVEKSEILLTTRPLLERLMQTHWAPSIPNTQSQDGMDLLYEFKTVFENLAM